MLFFPQQQQQQHQQIVQTPTLMYTTSPQNFHQPYPGNIPIHLQQQQPQQQSFMFIPSRPHLQQSWILQSHPQSSFPPATSMPTFIQSSQTNFHHMQPPQPQSSFNSGPGIPQPSFSGGTAISQSSFNNNTNVPPPSTFRNGTGIPQPSFSGGTAVLKRKSHYLDEPEYDTPVSLLFLFK